MRFRFLKILLLSAIMAGNFQPSHGQVEMAQDLTEALTFTKYPTHGQYLQMMEQFATDYPDICRVDTIGESTLGRPILAVKISDNVHTWEDEPAFFYSSTMHGDEIGGYVFMLRLIQFLLSSYGSDVEVDRLINELEIWINPISNPDGTYLNNDATISSPTRSNANGYDLNRYYPNILTGSDDTTGLPLENQKMMLFMRKHRFNLSANIHGGAEVVNYPWDHSYNSVNGPHKRHPDNNWFVFISQEYADEARSVNPAFMAYFVDDSTGITGITHGADWYPVSTGRQDYVTYFLNGREVTLELHQNKELASNLLDTYWNINQWSLINYMSQARYGIHGNVVDLRSGEPMEAKVFVINHDNDSSYIYSDPETGNFYRYLKEGQYQLRISAEGYKTDTAVVNVLDYQRTELFAELDSTATSLPREAIVEPRIFPNPLSVNGQLQIRAGSEPIVSFQMLDLSGRVLGSYQGVPAFETGSFSIPQAQPGHYILRLQHSQKVLYLSIILY